MITKHSKLLSVIDAIETRCSPFEIKKMGKYDDFKLFSDSSDDESDAFLPNVSNTSIAGEITDETDKDTGNTEVILFYSRLAKIYSKSTNCTVKLPLS